MLSNRPEHSGNFFSFSLCNYTKSVLWEVTPVTLRPLVTQSCLANVEGIS